MKVVLLMLLGHMLADYTLQGWLADGKQRKWWDKAFGGSLPPKYAYDYLAALFCHALYWSLIVLLPLYASPWWAVAVLANAAVHAVVDDLKANRCVLNLWQDQLLHLVQIVITYLLI